MLSLANWANKNKHTVQIELLMCQNNSVEKEGKGLNDKQLGC